MFCRNEDYIFHELIYCCMIQNLFESTVVVSVGQPYGGAMKLYHYMTETIVRILLIDPFKTFNSKCCATKEIMNKCFTVNIQGNIKEMQKRYMSAIENGQYLQQGWSQCCGG